MSRRTSSDRNAGIAAAMIIFVAGAGFFVMPTLMMSLSEISPWLAAVAAASFVAGFFVVFWLRARAQRRAEGEAKHASEADGAAPLIAAAVVLVWFLGLTVLPGFVGSLDLAAGLPAALIGAYVLMLLPGLWLLARLRR